MITHNTPYNPIYHANIPRNYREQMREIGMNTGDNIITDEEIFLIWRDHYGDDYESEGFENYDEYVIELIECWINAAQQNMGE